MREMEIIWGTTQTLLRASNDWRADKAGPVSSHGGEMWQRWNGKSAAGPRRPRAPQTPRFFSLFDFIVLQAFCEAFWGTSGGPPELFKEVC